MTHPWFKFWPSSWLGDPQLRLCSQEARGLLIDCLSVMHQAKRRGYLETAMGAPIDDPMLCRLIGANEPDIERCRNELIAAGVVSVDDDGVMYSRRMVKESAKAEKCARAGKAGGGNPAFRSDALRKGEDTEQKDGKDIRKKIDDIGAKVPFEQTFKGEPKGQDKPKPKRKPKRIEYGEDFDKVWAAYGRYGSKPRAWRYWQIILDEDKAAIAANIPIYLKCITAGRTKKQFEGWINPENAAWDSDWEAVLADMTAPIPARKIEDAYHNSERKSLLG